MSGTVSPCAYFSLLGDPSFALTAAQSKTFTFRFAPTEAGYSYGCTVHVADPVCQTVELNGMSR